MKIFYGRKPVTVKCGGADVEVMLPPAPYALFNALQKRAPEFVTFDELCSELEISKDSVKMAKVALFYSLDSAGSDVNVNTKRGVGYALK